MIAYRPAAAKALLSPVSSSDAGLPKRRWLPWSPRPMRGVAAGAWMLPESSTSWAAGLQSIRVYQRGSKLTKADSAHIETYPA